MSKIFGILFIIAGIGLFIGMFSGKPNAGAVVFYAIGFIALGIYLYMRSKK